MSMDLPLKAIHLRDTGLSFDSVDFGLDSCDVDDFGDSRFGILLILLILGMILMIFIITTTITVTVVDDGCMERYRRHHQEHKHRDDEPRKRRRRRTEKNRSDDVLRQRWLFGEIRETRETARGGV